MIAVGEFLIGLGLILAHSLVWLLLQRFDDMNFLLAGSLNSGPVLLVLAILIMIAWKIAGYYGLNRFIFKYIGTFWKPGLWFRKK